MLNPSDNSNDYLTYRSAYCTRTYRWSFTAIWFVYLGRPPCEQIHHLFHSVLKKMLAKGFTGGNVCNNTICRGAHKKEKKKKKQTPFVLVKYFAWVLALVQKSTCVFALTFVTLTSVLHQENESFATGLLESRCGLCNMCGAMCRGASHRQGASLRLTQP